MLHLEKNSAKYLLSNVGQLVGLQTPVFCEQNEHWIVKEPPNLTFFLSVCVLIVSSNLSVSFSFIFALDLFIDSRE